MSNTVTLYVCDECNNVITNPENGLVIKGVIQEAKTMNPGVLIGEGNFPEGPDNFAEHMVKTTSLCVPCFLKKALPNHKLTATR